MRENPKSSRIRIASEIAVPASTFTFEWYYSQARPHSARLLHLPQSRSSQQSTPIPLCYQTARSTRRSTFTFECTPPPQRAPCITPKPTKRETDL
ncbi:hypothetical protein Zmor_019743 [Zophobas morio]|uniref:Uncharacterized protein n=1 Tax=Zophobas morio TaxID=2755281 RepID=A0AA38I6E1_9CUCU|nr:hypothetical protein Zmor_019743 [Zophobas morio]